MNRNIIRSNGTPVANTLFDADVSNYLQANTRVQRFYPIMKWQLEDIFSLFNEAVFRIRRIEDPENVEIALLPLDDSLKNYLLIDSSNDYYFVLTRSEFETATDVLLEIMFSLVLAKTGNNFYFYLEGITLPIGVGENPTTNGARIPNPGA